MAHCGYLEKTLGSNGKPVPFCIEREIVVNPAKDCRQCPVFSSVQKDSKIPILRKIYHWQSHRR